MTAALGIFNRSCIVLAADSALSIQNRWGKKILNTGNKIFGASKHHPFAIVIYNNIEFMAVPWETIIKQYRSSLGRKNFPTTLAFKEDFVAYLNTNLASHIPPEAKKWPVYFAIDLLGQKLGYQRDQKWDTQAVIEKLNADEGGVPPLVSMGGLGKEAFRNEYYELIKADLIERADPSIVLENELVDLLFEKIYSLIIGNEWFEKYTGMCFAGYGSDEIFPSFEHCLIGQTILGHLRLLDVDSGKVSLGRPSEIIPMGQTETARTFMLGIGDQFLNNIYTSLTDSLLGFCENIAQRFSNDEALKKELVGYADIYHSIMQEQMQNYCKMNHLLPLLDAVASLSKDQLIDFAESVINLTSLKQRVTMESESVGGPVDIAVITKGDGLVWIKRKHYFPENLNRNFFTKYFDDEA